MKTIKKKTKLIEPAIEKLSEKAGNKYILCNVVAKRAKEIIKEKNDPSYDKKDDGVKEITEAAMELEKDELEIENLPEEIVEEIEEEKNSL